MAKHAVIRPEIVPPMRNAVCFINGPAQICRKKDIVQLPSQVRPAQLAYSRVSRGREVSKRLLSRSGRVANDTVSRLNLKA